MKKVVGITYHNNFSLSTSYYTFLYYKWPVLSLAGSCTANLVESHYTGMVYQTVSDISEMYKIILLQYNNFKKVNVLSINKENKAKNLELLDSCF